MIQPITAGSFLPSRTMASALEDVIRRDIITGAFSPGMKLRVRELGERYDAGPIPLREALSRLCASGLVVAVDQKGFRVAEVSLKELEDITRTRQEIERLAITRAIEDKDPQWEGELLSAHHQLQQFPVYQSDRSDKVNPDWERAHTRFHETLTAGCKSEWLVYFASILRDQTARYRHLSAAAPRAHDRDLASEHAGIVKAVLDHDAPLASRLLTDHFGRTTMLVVAALNPLLNPTERLA